VIRLGSPPIRSQLTKKANFLEVRFFHLITYPLIFFTSAFIALVMHVARGRGQRFLVLGTGLLGFWIVLVSTIVAGMSMTGDWDFL